MIQCYESTVREISECHGLPVLCQAYVQEVNFENSPSNHETQSIWCHVEIHVDFKIILHSLNPVIPQA